MSSNGGFVRQDVYDAALARIRELEDEVEAWKVHARHAFAGVGDYADLVQGNPWGLTPTELHMLLILLAAKGTVSHSQLMDGLYTHKYQRTPPNVELLKVFACKIRKKLAKDGLGEAICSVWGVGYTIAPPHRGDVVERLGFDPQKSESRHSAAKALGLV